MHRLRFTTLVEAPLTVAFDVARTLGRPWGTPLQEVVSLRPERDVYAVGPGHGWRWLTHSRRFSATGAGTLVEDDGGVLRHSIRFRLFDRPVGRLPGR